MAKRRMGCVSLEEGLSKRQDCEERSLMPVVSQGIDATIRGHDGMTAKGKCFKQTGRLLHHRHAKPGDGVLHVTPVGW